MRALITPVGNAARDQWVFFQDNGRLFKSYGSSIAHVTFDGEVTLFNPFWDMYSVTTNRYLLQFLNEDSIKDVREKVKSGEYRVK